MAGLTLVEDCGVCEAANQILLQGTVAEVCTINVTPGAGATALPLAVTGAQHVQVGTVAQSCNKKLGYTLTVSSAACAGAPAGAKVIEAASADQVAYSAEFANPTTGGSTASVTGLLATTCAAQIARKVTNSKVTGETSTVFVNFTGVAGLSSGTYQDTLTVTMSVK